MKVNGVGEVLDKKWGDCAKGCPIIGGGSKLGLCTNKCSSSTALLAMLATVMLPVSSMETAARAFINSVVAVQVLVVVVQDPVVVVQAMYF